MNLPKVFLTSLHIASVISYLLNSKDASPQRRSYQKLFWNMQRIYRSIHMLKCDFKKVAKQLYWNDTSGQVFFCKFAAYFQNTFSIMKSGGLLQWIWTLFSLFNPFLCFNGIAQTRLFLLNSAWIYWFLFSSALIIVLVFSSPSHQKDGREQKYDY